MQTDIIDSHIVTHACMRTHAHVRMHTVGRVTMHSRTQPVLPNQLGTRFTQKVKVLLYQKHHQISVVILNVYIT